MVLNVVLLSFFARCVLHLTQLCEGYFDGGKRNRSRVGPILQNMRLFHLFKDISQMQWIDFAMTSNTQETNITSLRQISNTSFFLENDGEVMTCFAWTKIIAPLIKSWSGDHGLWK